MKKSHKKTSGEEEEAGKDVSQLKDEKSEIQQFIRKKQLENQILKKLTDELENRISNKKDRSKSA